MKITLGQIRKETPLGLYCCVCHEEVDDDALVHSDDQVAVMECPHCGAEQHPAELLHEQPDPIEELKGELLAAELKLAEAQRRLDAVQAGRRVLADPLRVAPRGACTGHH